MDHSEERADFLARTPDALHPTSDRPPKDAGSEQNWKK
jgi:hypothetical protein